MNNIPHNPNPASGDGEQPGVQHDLSQAPPAQHPGYPQQHAQPHFQQQYQQPYQQQYQQQYQQPQQNDPSHALYEHGAAGPSSYRSGADAHVPSTVFGNLTLGGALVVILWPLLALAGYHFLVVQKSDDVLAAAIKSRPGVVVGNVQRTVQAGVESGLPLNQSINKANAQFQAYAKRGYVVLDSNAVLAAPNSAAGAKP